MNEVVTPSWRPRWCSDTRGLRGRVRGADGRARSFLFGTVSPARARAAVLVAALTGGTVLIAGAAILVVRSSRVVGWLAVLLGVAWIFTAGAGATFVPVIMPAIASAVPPLVVVLLLALTVAVGDTTRRSVAAGAVALAVALGVALALVQFASYDPFFDIVGCVGCDPTDPVCGSRPLPG